MRYTVEFEMQSDFHATISESVRKALVSTFGSVEKFSIVPCREYIGYVQKNQNIIWHEVGPTGEG